MPRPFWAFVAPPELSIVAPLVHDYLCQTDGARGRYTPRAAHTLFFSIMLRENVPLWRAVPAFLAVVLFGPKWKAG